MSTVVVTGASGFVGRAVCTELRERGWDVIGVSRTPEAASAAQPELEWIPLEGRALEDALAGCGRCVNLVGQHPFEGRWTEAYKRTMQASRVGTTARVAAALAGAPGEERVLVNASGVVYYGNCGDEVVTEDRPAATPFVAAMCRDWEAAAAAAEEGGVRVARMRIGMGLGRDGGALPMIERPFRFGLGGPVGTGRQFVPWIHEADLGRAFVHVLEEAACRGPYNVAAPEPVRSREFATALGRVLHRPARLPAPRPLLRLAVGEASAIMLWSCRADTSRLAADGFTWRHPHLDEALAALYEPALALAAS